MSESRVDALTQVVDLMHDELTEGRKPEIMAKRFHEAYERLAPLFGYVTNESTRIFNPESTNGKLMIAVCTELFPLTAAFAEYEKDAQRYAELKLEPVGGAHLLSLLAAGKGTEKSFDKMLDRLRNSRLAAIQKGIDKEKKRL